MRSFHADGLGNSILKQAVEIRLGHVVLPVRASERACYLLVEVTERNGGRLRKLNVRPGGNFLRRTQFVAILRTFAGGELERSC